MRKPLYSRIEAMKQRQLHRVGKPLATGVSALAAGSIAQQQSSGISPLAEYLAYFLEALFI